MPESSIGRLSEVLGPERLTGLGREGDAPSDFRCRGRTGGLRWRVNAQLIAAAAVAFLR